MKTPLRKRRAVLLAVVLLIGAGSFAWAAVEFTYPNANRPNQPPTGHSPAIVASPGTVQALDLEGRPVDPFAGSRDRVTVLLFTRTDCPIANRYAPEWRRLSNEFSAAGVSFYLIYADPDESADIVRRHLDEFALPGAALRDPRALSLNTLAPASRPRRPFLPAMAAWCIGAASTTGLSTLARPAPKPRAAICSKPSKPLWPAAKWPAIERAPSAAPFPFFHRHDEALLVICSVVRFPRRFGGAGLRGLAASSSRDA